MAKRGKGRIPRHAPPARRREPRYLDSFTEFDLEFWDTRSVDAARYGNNVYFDLEKQRVAHHDELVAAVRDAGGVEVPVDGWVRITEYQWCLAPLSAAGSLKRIGGRFNIGEDLDLRAKPFPALYIAHDYDTAMQEYFGGPPSASALSAHEMMLRRPNSFATFVIDGHLHNVFDLRELPRLDAFVSIIKRFTLTKETREFARRNGLAARKLVRSSRELHDRVLASSNDWRMEPLLVDLRRQARSWDVTWRRPDTRDFCTRHSKEGHCASRSTRATSPAPTPICKCAVLRRPDRHAYGSIARTCALRAELVCESGSA